VISVASRWVPVGISGLSGVGQEVAQCIPLQERTLGHMQAGCNIELGIRPAVAAVGLAPVLAAAAVDYPMRTILRFPAYFLAAGMGEELLQRSTGVDMQL